MDFIIPNQTGRAPKICPLKSYHKRLRYGKYKQLRLWSGQIWVGLAMWKGSSLESKHKVTLRSCGIPCSAAESLNSHFLSYLPSF